MAQLAVLQEDLAISKSKTKKAEADSLRNEQTYHLLRDKSDMLQRELNALCEERIELQQEKHNFKSDIKGLNDQCDSYLRRIKMYGRQTEEQARDIELYKAHCEQKNVTIAALQKNFSEFKQ